MGNEILKPEETRNFINAENGVQVAHADSFTPTINIFMPGSTVSTADFTSNYYNLFIGYDANSSKYINVDRKRALSEYIAPEVSAKFGGWSDEAIDKIKKLPAVIIDERNKDIINEQQGVIATIKNIQLRQFEIAVSFQIVMPITMRFIQDNMSDLGLEHEWELNRTHWTIKNTNLLEVLADAGLNPESK